MNTLASIIDRFQGRKITVIGDSMLDSYIYGVVDRISPEAPIPILKIESKTEVLGGAANVVRNLDALGCTVEFFSIVGADDPGRKIIRLLTELNRVHANIIEIPGAQTTCKTRYIANQQLLRVDEEAHEPAPKHIEDGILTQLTLNPHPDVFILSDYGKGLLSPALCKAIIAFANRIGKPILIDPKGRDYSHYANATLIKPNRKELCDYFNTEIQVGYEFDYAARLASVLHIQHVLITLGKAGMLVCSHDRQYHIAAKPRDLADVSGAGDTVIATLAAAWSAGAGLEDACRLANLAAGIVVAKSGTSVVFPYELRDQLHDNFKVHTTTETLLTRLQAWRDKKYRIGFTNGCFDLLHAGHIATIHAARSQCDKLIIALNSDASVKRLKGHTRPIKTEEERACILSEFESVDAVIVFDDNTPENLILTIKPDVLIKGGDYRKDDVVGASFVESYGGTVVLTPVVTGRSSTNILQRIQYEITGV